VNVGSSDLTNPSRFFGRISADQKVATVKTYFFLFFAGKPSFPANGTTLDECTRKKEQCT
jgi:hypothetical protein